MVNSVVIGKTDFFYSVKLMKPMNLIINADVKLFFVRLTEILSNLKKEILLLLRCDFTRKYEMHRRKRDNLSFLQPM